MCKASRKGIFKNKESVTKERLKLEKFDQWSYEFTGMIEDSTQRIKEDKEMFDRTRDTQSGSAALQHPSNHSNSSNREAQDQQELKERNRVFLPEFMRSEEGIGMERVAQRILGDPEQMEREATKEKITDAVQKNGLQARQGKVDRNRQKV